MSTFLAADPNAPAPTSRQRTWLFAALRADDGLMPPGVPLRSLNLMRERGWLKRAPLPIPTLCRPATRSPRQAASRC